MGESRVKFGVPRLRIDSGPLTPRTDHTSCDRSTLTSPPARENSEANTEGKLVKDSIGDPNAERNYAEFLDNYQKRTSSRVDSKDGCEGVLDGESEEDSDREDVLQAIERVSFRSACLTDTDADTTDGNEVPEIQLDNFDNSGYQSDDEDDGIETEETSTLTPRSIKDKDERDMDPKTVAELQRTLGKQWSRKDLEDIASNPYGNQYLRSTPSPENELLDLVKVKRDITGVTWDSSVNTPTVTPTPRVARESRASRTSTERELNFSRNASRLAMESREAMFRRAMSLLSARCTSVRHELSAGERLPFGYQVPKYFYVTQEKPVPMEPLKAWRGYNGNIYFEPIQVRNVNDGETETRAKTSLPRAAKPQPMTPVPKPRSQPDKENRPMTEGHRPVMESRSDSRNTNKSSQGSLLMSTRQMAILDKQAVLSRYNESLHEDLTWLEGQENTGSLAVRPKTFPERTRKDRDRDLQYNKERIKKGSVAHKLYVENKAKQKPKLSVSGGKFVPPTSMSPLLRTQTQYSLSSQRLTTNSPDPYHLNDSKLPPLDQIRATIKHMDNKSDTSYPSGKVVYNRAVTITDEMKPFVKYSPDVVAKLSQQANVC